YSAILFDHDVAVVPHRLALAALRRNRPTVVMGVPEFLETLVKGFDTQGKEASERFNTFLGGRVRYLWTGSAPITKSTLQIYEQLGVAVFQGYGMNETCIVSKNFPGSNRVGSVGRVLPNKIVRIDSTGQILVKSRFPVTDRYLNMAAQEWETTFRKDGYIATGDTGHFDEGGYLYITGRLKEII